MTSSKAVSSKGAACLLAGVRPMGSSIITEGNRGGYIGGKCTPDPWAMGTL